MDISKPGSHADHLLRQTRMHHIQLSSMADFKANILLTTSLIVITMSVKYLDDAILKWPTVNMLCFCLLTMLLATYVVMPHLPFIVRRRKDINIKSPSFNLLFFGDFVSLNYDAFSAGMEDALDDPSNAYEVQVREIYLLGEFLARKKYRYLRLAYLTLLLGLFSSSALLVWTRLVGPLSS
ncbi:MAG: hypothetical protein ACI8TQ_000145 [Planctomycetota bacterium]|jgi:hypothetical protein